MDKQPNEVNSGAFAQHGDQVGVWLSDRSWPAPHPDLDRPDGTGATIMQAMRDAFHELGHPVPTGMTDMDRLQQTVGEWGSATFPLPDHDPLDHAYVIAEWEERLLAHLREEVDELEVNITYPPVDPPARRDWIAEEAADVVIMLMHLAHREGFSLMEAIEAKYERNLNRTWETVPGEGRAYRKHVERARVVHVDDRVPGAIYIGRGMPRLRLQGSRWANPYRIGATLPTFEGENDRRISREDAVSFYRHDLEVGNRRGMLASLPELRGKVLACWCRHDGEALTYDNACHGDVLVSLLDEYTDDELRAIADGDANAIH